jgi:DNA-directed RNA polymerase specialized sigma24 family protein
MFKQRTYSALARRVPGRIIPLQSVGAYAHAFNLSARRVRGDGHGVAPRRRIAAMGELSGRPPHVSPKQSPTDVLTEASFEKLLVALGGDRETAGQKYEHLRRGVVRFFEWRGCRSADEYADEVLDRAARKLAEGADVPDVFPYVRGIARFVLKQFWRDQEKERKALRESPPPVLEPTAERDRRLACIDRCLECLAADERELLLAYYRDDKRQKIDNRKDLAERLGVPAPTLRMRAHRLRVRLEACVRDCTKV